MIVLCILVLIYFIFNITSIVNVFMLSIEKKTTKQTNSWEEKGKTLTVEWQTSIKKFYSAATQISITETLQTNKQTKPKKHLNIIL